VAIPGSRSRRSPFEPILFAITPMKPSPAFARPVRLYSWTATDPSPIAFQQFATVPEPTQSNFAKQNKHGRAASGEIGPDYMKTLVLDENCECPDTLKALLFPIVQFEPLQTVHFRKFAPRPACRLAHHMLKPPTAYPNRLGGKCLPRRKSRRIDLVTRIAAGENR
jgi:hypothetical protein